jgi:hypothetical protein
LIRVFDFFQLVHPVDRFSVVWCRCSSKFLGRFEELFL